MFGKILWLILASISVVEVVPQEFSTPASFLQPKDFNYHPYLLRQYLEQTKPTKQGPVLFPNDGPPPPRQPLVVTSRPLIESIAKSDRNPNPPNSSPQPNVLNPIYPIPSPTDVTLPPIYLSINPTVANNDLFGNIGQDSVNNIPQASSYNQVPYAEMLKKARLNGYLRTNGFNDYEERTVVPPVYKVISNYAKQNVLKKKPSNLYNYQIHNLDYENQYDIKSSDGNDNVDYDQNQNYAFSYRVNDQKSGDDFSHKQESTSGGTNGEYRVLLPDGRTQIVSYTADDNGYKADVRYDNGNVAFDNNNYINNNNNVKQYNNQNIESNYYVDRNYKDSTPIKEEADQYNSKEYYDYSSEYQQNYEPYNNKFAIFRPISTPIVTTARPNYNTKNLFTVAPSNQAVTYTDGVISATNNPLIPKYVTTTERVVLIGGNNLYANLNNVVPSVSTPTVRNPVSAVTPASYLASTIASLRDRFTPKPVVFGNFIDRISKYLTHK